MDGKVLVGTVGTVNTGCVYDHNVCTGCLIRAVACVWRIDIGMCELMKVHHSMIRVSCLDSRKHGIYD